MHSKFLWKGRERLKKLGKYPALNGGVFAQVLNYEVPNYLIRLVKSAV
jgi:hypothetical protein